MHGKARHVNDIKHHFFFSVIEHFAEKIHPFSLQIPASLSKQLFAIRSPFPAFSNLFQARKSFNPYSACKRPPPLHAFTTTTRPPFSIKQPKAPSQKPSKLPFFAPYQPPDPQAPSACLRANQSQQSTKKFHPKASHPNRHQAIITCLV